MSAYDAEPGRRPLYHQYIKDGVLKPGCAVDNNAAIYFEDNEVRKVVALDENSNAYFVSLKNGEVVEEGAFKGSVGAAKVVTHQ